MQLNEFHVAIFAGTCVLSDRPPVLWWLSHGEVWDALTTENEGACDKYVG